MRDTVVIVGGGKMGAGIACCAALAGNRTVIIDITQENAERGQINAAKNIDEVAQAGLYTTEQAEQAKALLAGDTELARYRDSASMVIEAIFENLPLKQNKFKELDKIFPAEVPICSNTSGLRITDISALCEKHVERTVTTHFWFPGHLVPLVEVVVGDRTDIEVAKAVKATLNSWGKAAVLVKRDLPGQLANRILQAVIRESVNIVEIGLADPEDVDTAVKMGMGIRFPVWAPLEHIDAARLDLCQNVQRTVLPEISARQDPSPVFAKHVDKGEIGYESGKGIYDWSVKDMDELAKNRNDFIIYARKFMMERGLL